MIIDTHSILLDYDGVTPLKHRNDEVATENGEIVYVDGKVKMIPHILDLTAGLAIRESLNYGFPRDKEIDGDEKFRRFDISLRVQGAISANDGKMSLTAKEVVLILDSAKRFLGVASYGRLRQLLEPDEGVKEKKDKGNG